LTRLAPSTFVALLSGCGLVVGLGDPKQYAEPGRPGSGTSAPRGTDSVQAAQIAMAPDHGCATIDVGLGSPDNGSVRCWGANGQGQLGVDPNSRAQSSQPLAVGPFPGGFKGESLALGVSASCAISTDFYLVCWGGLEGVSDTTGVHPLTPAPAPSVMLIGGISGRQLSAVAAASLNEHGGCALEGRSLVCWGSLSFTGNGTTSVSDAVYVGVSAGANHACAISERDGAPSRDVECWGANTSGQANPAAVGPSVASPVALNVGPDVKAVAAGGAFTCALYGNGSVSCWGGNDRGQLGPNAPASNSGPTPIPFENGLGASAIAAGDGHVCAIMSDPQQSVQCWGDGSLGQLGRGIVARGTSATPKRVQRLATVGTHEDLPHVIAIAAGGNTTCIVSSTDAEVTCWGANDVGQAGQKLETPIIDVATAVAW
jgi:alpha-tubulin suppressor-like RCC1 family protein